ncbi:pilus assembly protein PilB [candidate division LCP-89 bacterium B3_LCP]|uniref:Pilus assembly protein PilB n=1 Tax=candidate division LCP-89 bacterium B3_LCP TaxID=2012998 RepID=A0A532UY45_UNCL8|nr:MAG: pilus assembly protein PilB [candidate division LCP-89 bacterium B3_LCP]
MKRGTRSGELLIDSGVIDQDLLDKAILIQLAETGSHRKLGEILIEDLNCDRHEIYRELARIYAFSEVDLEREELTDQRSQWIKNIYESVDKEHRDKLINNNILPFRLDGKEKNTLLILTDDPTDRERFKIAQKIGFRRLELAYARKELVKKWIETIYPTTNEFLRIIEEVSGTVENLDDGGGEECVDEDVLDQEINQSLLTNLIEGCLVEAVRRGVSDIHIVPGAGGSSDFLFRVDGKLEKWHTQDSIKPEAISAVVKDRSRNVDRFEREAAQDGFIQRNIDGHLLRFRVSIVPIVAAEYRRKLESIVIRVLDDRKVITDLGKLGLQKQSRKDFEKAISKPQGMVILTGPTGSGKSTTLIAALHQVISPEVNVLTVEDPVEYMIRGARQLKIGYNLDFEGAIRAILRHDPDIVMVGEMRDKQTADIAIKLANTGHLTFSTLHTNDAPAAISRLFKMGVEPFLISYAINIVVAQRLIRTLCTECRTIDTDLSIEVPLGLGFTEKEIEDTMFYKAVGCDKCNYGYKGRAAIHETLFFTKKIRRLILESGSDIDEDAVRKESVKNGSLTLRMSGRERIKSGVTTCEEIAFATIED